MMMLLTICLLLLLLFGSGSADMIQGHHPPGVGHHPPGVGHHPPGVGHHPPGVGHHPPGVGHHLPKRSPLERGYVALQAWKRLIVKDPLNITGSWAGRDVCTYTGVFCGQALHDPSLRVVSGIDLNHANLGGQLPTELGLLTELGIFHLNSNQFTGALPQSFSNLPLLGELDVSNNRFSGPFPLVTLQLPSLIYLHNQFYGSLPPEVFDKNLDALFVNSNNFDNSLPDNFGNSPVSVVVLANNRFSGSMPRSIGNMSKTLNEVIFLNNVFDGPLPSEIGLLTEVTVFDISSNRLSSSLPSSISTMVKLEQLNVANNTLSGQVTGNVCELPNIRNLTLSNNYFTGESASCTNLSSRGVTVTTSGNCISNQRGQKSGKECRNFYAPRAPPPSKPPPPRSPPRSPPPPPPPPPPPSPPPPPPSSPPCPEGYTSGETSGLCLMLVKELRTWNEAESYCRDHGGELAAVADFDELIDVGGLCSAAALPPGSQAALVDPYSPRGQGCYLGGKKTGDDSWTWPAASCINFNSSYWNFLEPNDLYGNENCTSIKYEPPILRASSASPAYMLNDLLCEHKLPFICSVARCT